MIFSVSNDSIEWSLDFGPDSVTLTVKGVVQEMTISSQEIPQAAWSLWFSQRQNFLNIHPARFPITPNQEGTMEMKEEVRSSVAAQNKGIRGYQVSDLTDIEFHLEDIDMKVDAVCQPGIDTPYSTPVFNIFELVSMVENPI